MKVEPVPKGESPFEDRYKYEVDPSIIKIDSRITKKVKNSDEGQFYHIARESRGFHLDCSRHGRLGVYKDCVDANVAMIRHNSEAHNDRSFNLSIKRR